MKKVLDANAILMHSLKQRVSYVTTALKAVGEGLASLRKTLEKDVDPGTMRSSLSA